MRLPSRISAIASSCEVRRRRNRLRALDRRGLAVLLLAARGSPAPPGSARGSTRPRPCACAGSEAVGLFQFDCFGFSPSANLMPSGAPAKSERVGPAAPAPLDDLVLAADRVGRAVQDVRGRRAAGELAVDRDVEGSQHVADADLGRDVVRALVDVASSMAVCECASMMPGVTCLPRPSISRAPAGAASAAGRRAATFPSTTSTSAPSRMPAGPCVQTVAPRTTTADGAASGPRLAGRRGRASRRALAASGGLLAAVAASVFFAARSIRVAVDPDLGDRGSSPRTARRRGRRGWRSCPASRVPRRSPRPSWRAGIDGHRRERVVRREPPPHGLAHADVEVVDLLEAVRRQRERDSGVAEPPRIAGRAVERAQTRRSGRPATPRPGRACPAAERRRAGRAPAWPPRPPAAAGTRRPPPTKRAWSFISRAIRARRAGARARRSSRRRRSRGPRPPARAPPSTPRSAAARGRPGSRAVRRLGVAPPERVQERLARRGHGAHVRGRIVVRRRGRASRRPGRSRDRGRGPRAGRPPGSRRRPGRASLRSPARRPRRRIPARR